VELAALGAEVAEGGGILAAMALGAEAGGAATVETGPFAAAGAAMGALVGLGIGVAAKFRGKKEETPDPRAVEADRRRERQERYDAMRSAEEDQARIDSAQNFTRLLAQQNRSEKEQALVEQYQWLASKGHRPLLEQVLSEQNNQENNKTNNQENNVNT
jgi:membrane protein implicated in regulation of membrane protease activity